MAMRWLGIFSVVAFWPAAAAAEMVRGQSPQTIVSALKDAGYKAKLGTDAVGDPMITSAVAGTTFQIFFYNCTNQFWFKICNCSCRRRFSFSCIEE